VKSRSGNGRPATVLCIDDSPESRALISRLLENEGCRVLTCKNGVRGLEAAERSDPDLILLDLALPFMDGYETANRLKALLAEEGRDVPVLAVSILSSPEDRDMALAAGCDGFIAKPLDADRFAEEIFAYHRGRRDRLPKEREREALLRFHRLLLRKLETRSESVLLDDETGLYNERYLYRRLDEEVSRSLRLKEPFSLLVIGFEGEGPDAEQKRAVAGVLRGHKRAYDVAFRLDGDVFAVLLGSCSEENASLVGGRICARIRAELGGDGTGAPPVLRLGANTYDSGHLDAGSFVTRARRRMAPLTARPA